MDRASGRRQDFHILARGDVAKTAEGVTFFRIAVKRLGASQDRQHAAFDAGAAMQGAVAVVMKRSCSTHEEFDRDDQFDGLALHVFRRFRQRLGTLGQR